MSFPIACNTLGATMIAPNADDIVAQASPPGTIGNESPNNAISFIIIGFVVAWFFNSKRGVEGTNFRETKIYIIMPVNEANIVPLE